VSRATVFVAFNDAQIIVQLSERYRQPLDIFLVNPDKGLVIMAE
jgi:hypothetical protein